jgi:hypothetical protein
MQGIHTYIPEKGHVCRVYHHHHHHHHHHFIMYLHIMNVDVFHI